MEFKPCKLWKKQHFKEASVLLSNELPIGWPTPKEAFADIIAIKKNKDAQLVGCFMEGALVGFGGYLKSYPTAFELHPLVVKKEYQGRGIGKHLVEQLEELAFKQGALTLYLGTDDEGEQPRTSLANKDLFQGTLEHIAAFQGGSHPASFYQKLGYSIVGVIPDANGLGRPDIYMAKKLHK